MKLLKGTGSDSAAVMVIISILHRHYNMISNAFEVLISKKIYHINEKLSSTT